MYNAIRSDGGTRVSAECDAGQPAGVRFNSQFSYDGIGPEADWRNGSVLRRKTMRRPTRLEVRPRVKNLTVAKRMAYWCIAAGAISAALFLFFPGIDPYVSAWFYVEGRGFSLSSVSTLSGLPAVLRAVAVATALFLLATVLWRSVAPAPDWVLNRHIAAYLLAVLIIGPGIVVNMGFKDNWGRARPLHTVEFGGDKQYSPALVVSSQCKRNCSFVSGDASLGFSLLALALAFPNRRNFWIGAGLAVGAGIGAIRILVGAHFLSDVVFACIFTVLVASILYVALMRGKVFSE